MLQQARAVPSERLVKAVVPSSLSILHPLPTPLAAGRLLHTLMAQDYNKTTVLLHWRATGMSTSMLRIVTSCPV